MLQFIRFAISTSAMLLPLAALADEATAQRPTEILNETVTGMPVAKQQEIRMLEATVGPLQTTVRHTHRFPVTTYVLHGEMTFALKGKPAITVKAGEAFIEPPNTPVTGANKSATDEAKVVIFYVSDPKTPFLDPIK